MRTVQATRLVRAPAGIAGVALLGLVVSPIAFLAFATAPEDLVRALQDERLLSALVLSVQTSVVALVITVLGGTPLAWWLARSDRRIAGVAEVLVELPIVVPPAVIGVGLLIGFGRNGPLGVSLAFTTTAVVFAQIIVSAPFFVRSAAAGFRRVDEDLLLVAQSLGASPLRAFARVAVPVARPSLVAGIGLAWARALGEFGATLLFAGNLPGRTQTMPLAIYAALESDVRVAQSIALVLAAFALLVFGALHFLSREAR